MNIELLIRLKERLNQMISAHILENRDIVVFGANHPGSEIIEYLRSRGIQVNAVLDNNPDNVGRKMTDIEIHAPEEYLGEYREEVCVLIASRYYPQMCSQLEGFGYQENVHIFQIIQLSVTSRYGVETSRFEEHAGQLREDVKIWKNAVQDVDMLFLGPVKSNGDIYFLAAYVREYAEREGIASWRVAAIGMVCAEIASMFGIEDVLKITQEECEALERIAALVGSRSKIMVVQPFSRHHDNLYRLSGYRGLNFADFYKVIYGLDESAKTADIKFPDTKVQSYTLFDREGLRYGKTVILAPKSNSLIKLSNKFWKELADRLKSIGLMVCTNIAGPSEKPVEGTKGIYFPFKMMKNILESAGYFISTRSGMCELACGTACKKIVLYPDISVSFGSMIDLYGLHNMGLADDALELIVDDEEAAIQQIIECIGEERNEQGTD